MQNKHQEQAELNSLGRVQYYTPYKSKKKGHLTKTKRLKLMIWQLG